MFRKEMSLRREGLRVDSYRYKDGELGKMLLQSCYEILIMTRLIRSEVKQSDHEPSEAFWDFGGTRVKQRTNGERNSTNLHRYTRVICNDFWRLGFTDRFRTHWSAKNRCSMQPLEVVINPDH